MSIGGATDTFKRLTYHVIALRCDKNKHKKGEENANGAPENGEGEIRQECYIETRCELNIFWIPLTNNQNCSLEA